MTTVPISDADARCAEQANGNNVFNTLGHDEGGNLVITDTFGQPAWRTWWRRFHAAGGTVHAGEPWPAVPPVDQTDTNRAAIRQALKDAIAPGSPPRTAMTANTTFVNLASPTNAQVVAQVKALSQQNKVIILRLLQATRLIVGDMTGDS